MSVFVSILTLFVLFFCIISLGSFAGLFSEKTGIVNIAIDGMMIVGATFYGLFATKFNVESPYMQIILLPLAGLMSAIFALLHGFITIKLKGNHIISGVSINLLAAAISIIMIKGLSENGNFFESPVNELALSVKSDNWKNIISLKLFLTILVLGLTFIFFSYTKKGLHFAAVGENPQAAASVGINVDRIKWIGVSTSGFIAGMAGGIFFQYSGLAFFGNVQGIGFLALTVLIMGRWKTILIILSAFIFALLYSISNNVGTGIGIFQPLGQYSTIIYIAPYIITLFILMFTAKSDGAPKAIGQPYDKSQK